MSFSERQRGSTPGFESAPAAPRPRAVYPDHLHPLRLRLAFVAVCALAAAAVAYFAGAGGVQSVDPDPRAS